jgi:DNA-binding HxlR family transcriptional regulator
MEDGTLRSPSHIGDTGATEQATPVLTPTGGQGVTDACNSPEATEIRQILNRVGDKWSILVIAMLDQRTRRFTELRREIEGISQRMLALTLRQLERDGLVDRTVYPVVPPKVEYALTDLGSTLLESVRGLVGWATEHRGQVAAARLAYDARQDDLTVVAVSSPTVLSDGRRR